jgi:hypothetical protein
VPTIRLKRGAWIMLSRAELPEAGHQVQNEKRPMFPNSMAGLALYGGDGEAQGFMGLAGGSSPVTLLSDGATNVLWQPP